jgi:hypothetical protein
MEQVTKEIVLRYLDPGIDSILESRSTDVTAVTYHFSQTEEFFLRLGSPYSVPSFEIHHDVRQTDPDRSYLERLHSVLENLVRLLPSAFKGLTYFFDPAEIFRPCFFRLYNIDGSRYLYLLRLDLSFRPQIHSPLESRTNDRTPTYSTDLLFLESDFIPLERVAVKDGRIDAFVVKQLVSNTWIGETGRGYSIQGIWIDRDLSKFFSKLFISPGKRLYPFYPFTCKYRTVCLTQPVLSPEGRTKHLPYLHRALSVVEPGMRSIERDLSYSEFSEELPSFQSLKKAVPYAWFSIWDAYTVTPYLTPENRKEWRIEFPYQ